MKDFSSIIFLQLLMLFLTMGCSKDKPPLYPFSTIDKSTYNPDYYVAKGDLIKDIDQYLDLINEVHSDPYRQISRNELNEFADSLKQDIFKQHNDSIHLFDCYYYLQLLSSKIEDGHTLIRRPTNWRKVFQYSFPLTFTDVKDTLIVRKNFGNNSIPLNSEIIKINGKEINSLKGKTLKYISGTLPHYKASSLAKELPFMIQTFFKYNSPWIIEYRFNGIVGVDTIRGLPSEQFIEKLLDDYYSNLITIDSVMIDSSLIPIIKLNAFNYDSYPDYTAIVDSFFTANNETENIIIDLSENTGGSGLWSLYLLDYLTDLEYSTYDVYKNRISQQFKEWAKYQLNSYYFSEGKPVYLFWFYRLFEDELYYKDILKAKSQTYVELDEQYQIPHDKKYKGRTFLLISEETWSAGVVFASIFSSEKMGYIIGNETGGRLGFNSDPIDIELCYSKLEAKIPTAILTLPGVNKNRGQKPDFFVVVSVKELQNNINPYTQTINQNITD